MARKRRSPLSVLSRQKPKKSRRASPGRKRRLLAICASIALLAMGFLAWKFWPASTTWTQEKAPQDLDWSVSLRTEGEVPLSDQTASDIIASVRKALGKGESPDLEEVARSAQRIDGFVRAHVLRVGPRQVIVSLAPRQAALCIEADILRFIGTDGTVFGSAGTGEDCPGPVLQGVFAPKRGRFELGDDQTVQINQDEQVVIHEALELARQAKATDLTLAGFTYQRHRGFFLTLKSTSVEVAVGHGPFRDKLERLRGILAKIEQKGRHATRIELDYQGKAFIKYKKM